MELSSRAMIGTLFGNQYFLNNSSF